MRPGCAPASPSLWTSRLEDRRPSRHLIISSTTMLSPTIVCERPPPSLRALVTATPSHVSDLYCHAHHCYSATQLPGRGLLKLATYLPSPPSSPSLPPSDPTFSVHPFNPARLACPSPSLTARISRVHKTPYHTIGQRQYTLFKMSQGPYATWPAGVKTEHEQFSGSSQGSMTASRRSGSSDHQQAASFAYGSYPQVRETSISPMVGRGMLMIRTYRARLTAVCNHALGCVGIPVPGFSIDSVFQTLHDVSYPRNAPS